MSSHAAKVSGLHRLSVHQTHTGFNRGIMPRAVEQTTAALFHWYSRRWVGLSPCFSSPSLASTFAGSQDVACQTQAAKAFAALTVFLQQNRHVFMSRAEIR